MKILLSPSKEMNIENMIKKPNDINISAFKSKSVLFEFDYSMSKKAIKLYNGLAFRQLNELDSDFYKNVIILSSLYGYSYATDYISCYRLDYTSKEGRLNRSEIYNEINQMLEVEDVVYNLASNEFFKGIKHHNIIEFKFFINDKQISAISKKMRGAMVEFIRINGEEKISLFNVDGFKFNENLSSEKLYVYEKAS